MGLVAENGQEGAGMSLREQAAETPSLAPPSRLLIVTMGGRFFALDAESVRKLLTEDETGNGGVPQVEGVAYRSIDLADQLALSRDGAGVNTRVVLLSENGSRGSIRVACVHVLRNVQPSLVLPLPSQFCGSERRWYRGMILFEHSVALMLDTRWILENKGLEA
jgi:chemotaxis signal transduction protein